MNVLLDRSPLFQGGGHIKLDLYQTLNWKTVCEVVMCTGPVQCSKS